MSTLSTFLHSINEHWSQVYTMPDTVLETGHVKANKTKFLPHEAHRLGEKRTTNE